MLRVRHSPIHFEVAEGVVLAGDAWGEPDAPPVVLLTGAGQTRHAWGQTGEALAAAGFRAIAVDHRGHGDSTWPTGADACSEESRVGQAWVRTCRARWQQNHEKKQKIKQN